jgi:hypothetical protein
MTQSRVGYEANLNHPQTVKYLTGACFKFVPCNPEDQPKIANVSCEEDPRKCIPPNNAEQSIGGSQGGVPGSSSSGATNPNQQAIDHISQAQFTLQNGDTEGGKGLLGLAKQALGCNPLDPRGC